MNSEFLQLCLSWPALPFTLLLCLVTLYWLMVIVSGIGVDMIDLDVDFDADFHGSLADWGMMGVRWFNLGDVPLMVWVSVLALASWWVTMTFDREMAGATGWQIAGVVARNLGIGLLAAKLITQPLKGKLKHREPNTLADLLGRVCVVKTSEISPEFGQIECPTDDGAPLYLNARSTDGTIPRGTSVEIIDYSPESKTYFVRPA